MFSEEDPNGVVANVLVCKIIVSEIHLKWVHYIYFQIGKGMNSLTPTSYGLISNTTVLYKDGFGIK